MKINVVCLISLWLCVTILQPDISKFSSELLPILFTCLGKAAEDVDKDPRGVTKAFYAVEMFCENLGEQPLCSYSGPPLIRPPCSPRNCGHIRKVAFGEREKCIQCSSAKNLWPHYRGWPLLRVATKRRTTVCAIL